jgi:glycosyltransferase involved in cell wall biosynthesis
LTIYFLFPIIRKLSEKKNILILLTASYGGGAERLILDQGLFFDRDKFNLHIITLREGNIESQFRELKEVSYLCLYSPKKFSFKNLRRLIKYIKENNIHLLHAQLFESEFYAFLLKLFIPILKIIVTKHNANEFKKKFLFGFLGKIMSLVTDKIIAVSDSIKDFTIKYEFVKPIKILTIYNGINTSKFQRNIDKDEITNLRNSFCIKENDFVIGVIGRFTKQKGHIILVKAVEYLKEKIHNLKIIMIGDGELKEEILIEIKQKGLETKFLLTGHLDDMSMIYSILDILCVPSLWEGLSLVQLEAMSTENLVIISDLQNNLEVAEENTEAVFFKTGNYEDLANKILYFYQNPHDADSIKTNARKKIIAKFDFKDNLKKLENLYSRLLYIK